MLRLIYVIFELMQCIWRGLESANILRVFSFFAFSPLSLCVFLLVAICIQWCLHFPSSPGGCLRQPGNLCQIPDHANPITVSSHEVPGAQKNNKSVAAFQYNIHNSIPAWWMHCWWNTLRNKMNWNVLKLRGRPQSFQRHQVWAYTLWKCVTNYSQREYLNLIE